MDNTTSLQDSPNIAEMSDTNAPTARVKLNEELIEHLQAALKDNPEVDLASVIPWDYRKRIRGTAVPKQTSHGKPPGRAGHCANLVAYARTATIIQPLSSVTTSFLSEYMDSDAPSQDLTQCLVFVLKRMISDAERLWESPIRGVVLKCNDNLVAKISYGSSDYTEYTSLQYLSEHAPDIPAPKPYGLVKLDSACIMFMTYFPSTTLEKVWGNLTHKNKVLIQSQLDEIFCKLRRLKKGPQRLGGVGGEGVKDDHREPHRSSDLITTTAQFEDFQFSISRGASTAWTTFLRSFLPRPVEDYAFTHGDVRMANIMVKADGDDNYVVSGIIDWEDSGFYPEYFESSRLLFTFTMHTESDWHAYLPASISPARYPVRWLITRLWEHTINNS